MAFAIHKGCALRVSQDILAYTYKFGGQSEKAIDLVLSGPNKVSTSSSAYAKALRAIESDLTGFRVWHAGSTLCEYMVEHHANLPQGPRVELGSGLGMCGITLAMLDAAADFEDAVYCTDRSLALLEHVNENAELNCVGGRVQTLRLAWGSENDLAELNKQMGTTPALVIGSDLVYALDALPDLMFTISMLDAELTLLSFRPRLVDPCHGSSEELTTLASLAESAGWQMTTVLLDRPYDAATMDEEGQEESRGLNANLSTDASLVLALRRK